jgi:uncharacterized repeat protein (TIGR02543 family)
MFTEARTSAKTYYAEGSTFVPLYFDAQGGSGLSSEQYDGLNVTFGEAYGELPIPGHGTSTQGFDGWYTAASGGTQITKNSIVPDADSITLYAHWSARKVSVYYNVMGGTHPATTVDGSTTYAWNVDCGYRYNDKTPFWDRRYKIQAVKFPTKLVILGELKNKEVLTQNKVWTFCWANEATNKILGLRVHGNRDSNYLRVAGNVESERIAEGARGLHTEYFQQRFYSNANDLAGGPIGNW